MMAIILCRDVVDHVKQFKAKLKPGILLSGKMFVNFWSTVSFLTVRKFRKKRTTLT